MAATKKAAKAPASPAKTAKATRTPRRTATNAEPIAFFTKPVDAPDPGHAYPYVLHTWCNTASHVPNVVADELAAGTFTGKGLYCMRCATYRPLADFHTVTTHDTDGGPLV